MALTMDEVRLTAETAAREVSPTLTVAGITLGGASDGAYIEVLVNIAGCRADACQVFVGAFRNVTSVELQQQIADKLRTHLAEHLPEY